MYAISAAHSKAAWLTFLSHILCFFQVQCASTGVLVVTIYARAIPKKYVAVISHHPCMCSAECREIWEIIADFVIAAAQWIVHLEGGGWCIDELDCLGRSKTDLGR
jgi:hypothetical protein